MAQGPFQSYVPPGVYTETETDQSIAGPPTGLQIPTFIGTGKETLRQVDLDLVRGSSASLDQLITEEDVSGRFIVDNSNPDNPELGSVDGSADTFKVKNFPIVRGDGQGRTTNRPQDVTVTVDGTQVAVAAVDGSRGEVTLQVAPPSNATVLVTYSFNRTDTKQTDDVSEQVSDDPAVLLGEEPEPYNIQSNNDVFSLNVNGTTHDITLQTGSSRTASGVAQGINSNNISGLTASADVDNQGQSRLQLQADSYLEILDGTANNVLGFISGQSTDRNDVFYTYDGPIVDGTNGGTVSNSPNDVTVTVDGTVVEVEALDGENRRVDLALPPAPGSTVEIEYFHNTFQNTFDHLPNSNITSVDRVGNAPGRNDFSEGLDYIVKDGKVFWGSSFTVEPGLTTSGSEPFDDTEIDARLKTSKIWFEQVERFESLGVGSSEQDIREIKLGNIPTEGDGSGTPTEDVDKVEIYHGPNFSAARDRGQVEIRKIEPENLKVIVEDPIPSQHQIFATYNYNRLRDDTYTLTKTQSGRVTISSDLRDSNLYNVRFGSSSAGDEISWPSGNQTEPDAFVQNATDAVNETVTVTFNTTNQEPAVITSTDADPYDIFANQSDHLAFTFNDSDNGVADVSVDPVDLNTSAFGVVISDEHDAGATFSPTSGTDATFEFNHQGTNYSADLTTASGSSITDMAEVIWRAVPNETEVKGTVSVTSSNNVSTTASTTYDITINGINITQADASFSGNTYSDAATFASDIQSTLLSALNSVSSGHSAGDITDSANTFNVLANDDDTISIVASEEISIADTTNAGDELEDLVGWLGGGVPNDDSTSTYTASTGLENTKVARTWEGSARDYLLLRTRDVANNPSQAESNVIEVLDGNANDLLGFDNFQGASAVESAVNKGATVLSGDISSTDISNLSNDEDDFVVSVDGTQYTVDGSNFSGVTTLSGLADQIETALDVAVVKGTETENFDLSVSRSYDVTINGTNVSSSISGTSSDSASTVASSLESDIESNSSLNGGDISGSDDFEVNANSDGTVSIAASTSLAINDAGGSNDLEDILGWAGGIQGGGTTYILGTTLQSSDIVTVVEEPVGATTSNPIRITSTSTTSTSSVEIGNGPANAHLQFNEGQSGGQRKATAAEVAAVLNNDDSASGAWADNSTGSTDLRTLIGTSDNEFINAAYVEAINEGGFGDYIRIKSFGVGSDVSFTVDQPSNSSALNDTGIGLTSNDSASGIDGEDGFNVSSSKANGSSGTGTVGQTYVDSNTTLTFTVQTPDDNDYANGDSFQLIVEEEMVVGAGTVNRAIPGIEMFISGLSQVASGDTSVLTTYDKGGSEPDIGDFYYITYNYEKSDFSTKLFTRFQDVQANYGELSPQNPLTLASYLAILNGSSLLATKQVKKAPGSQQATQQAYLDALKDLEKPIQAGITPDILVPLTTDAEVQSATVKNAEVQSSQRFGNERRGIFGVASGTLPQAAKELAQGLDSERAVLMYPDSAVITLTDGLGNDTSHIVDGRYLAAAMAGSAVSPAFDVATPWTRRDLVGFDRLNRSLDEVEKNQLATSGVTVLEDKDPSLEVRQGLTTNTDNRLVSTPSVIAIKDFVQQQTRSTLDQFVGLKNLQGRAQDVESALNGLLKSLVESDIIVSFTGVSATPDQDDPTQLNVEALYSPVFPLLYIPVRFTLSSNSVG